MCVCPSLARYHIAQLDKELQKVPQLNQLELATGVPKTYFVLGAASFFTLMIFFNIAGQLFSNLLGFAYPAYRSFKALESPGKDDDKQWYVFFLSVLALYFTRVGSYLLSKDNSAEYEKKEA